MEDNMSETESKLRPILCELNQLSMPDGSVMLMQGDTAVMAGVYGPVEPKAQKLIYDKASVEVIYSPVKGPPKVDDRVVELYLKESCEAAIIVMLHPGSSISINVQEIQDNGGLLACAINAGCLALINSGISMKFTIAAVACMIEEGSGEIIIDPHNGQLQSAKAVLTFAYDCMNKDVVSCHTTGRFTEKEFLECMDKCRQSSVGIFDFYRDVVKNLKGQGFTDRGTWPHLKNEFFPIPTEGAERTPIGGAICSKRTTLATDFYSIGNTHILLRDSENL